MADLLVMVVDDGDAWYIIVAGPLSKFCNSEKKYGLAKFYHRKKKK